MSKRKLLERFFDEEAVEGKGKEKEDPMEEVDSEDETLGESIGDEDDVGPAPPPAKKRSVFRLCSRQLFLTYPKCDIPPEDVLALLTKKLSIQDHIVAQEKHKVR